MKRFLMFAVLATGTSLVMRKIVERAAPVMRKRCSLMCDRFLANMPQSFPPNRIVADLDALKKQNARILAVLEEREEVDGPQEQRRYGEGEHVKP